MLRRTISPRISETNYAGHIGHHVIPIWFEEGFTDIIRMFKTGLNSAPCTVMANLNVEFIHEMYFGENVEVTTSVTRIGKSSFALQHQIYQGERLCARGNVTFIYFDYVEKKAKPIPNDIRLKLEPHLIDE